jgi:hypothetical protein
VIPSHCNIAGNEEADKLANDRGRLLQMGYQISYKEANTVTKGQYYEQLKSLHTKLNAEDGYFKLSRREQVIILRLRTGRNELRRHLNTNF